MSPQHCKSSGHLALPQFSPAQCRKMVTEKNSDALTPAALTQALPAVAVPGHQGWRMLCSGGHSLPSVLGTSARKGIPALPTLPAPSQITTRSNSHSLLPPGLLLPQTWQGIPNQEGGSKWSTKAELPPCASQWHQSPMSTAMGAPLDTLPKAVGQTLKTES